MDHEGPQLEALTHRLSECPPEFLVEPHVGPIGTIDVAALVADHFRAIYRPPPRHADLAPFISVNPELPTLNRLRMVAIATWLVRDDWFVARPALGARTWELFTTGLDDIARVVRPEAVVSDPDRREEFVRVCLDALKLRPLGESASQARDRLTTLDSAERERVVRNTRAAEARAREIRERMARDAAAAAAQRYSPE